MGPKDKGLLVSRKCTSLGGLLKVLKISWASVAHICNPSYSGGRDQEDRSLKPAWANSLRDLIPKQRNHKKGLAEWLMV
jgi:hypothetical protein